VIRQILTVQTVVGKYPLLSKGDAW